MTEKQSQEESHDPVVDQKSIVANPRKKKASWLRTILWMLSMMLLVNVIMAVIAYILHRYKII